MDILAPEDELEIPKSTKKEEKMIPDRETLFGMIKNQVESDQMIQSSFKKIIRREKVGGSSTSSTGNLANSLLIMLDEVNEALDHSTKNYERWLTMRAGSALPLYLPDDLAFVLSFHMQRPLDYYKTCQNLFGRLIDFTSQSKKADLELTRKVWKDLYNTELGFCHTLSSTQSLPVMQPVVRAGSIEMRRLSLLSASSRRSFGYTGSPTTTPPPSPSVERPSILNNKILVKSASMNVDNPNENQNVGVPITHSTSAEIVRTTITSRVRSISFQPYHNQNGPSLSPQKEEPKKVEEKVQKDSKSDLSPKTVVKSPSDQKKEELKKLPQSANTRDLIFEALFSFPKSLDEVQGKVWFEAIAKYDFKAEFAGEMSLKGGERLFILKREDDGWFGGESLDGKKRGYFPATYCELVRRSTSEKLKAIVIK